jgi:hypothetical protein
LITEAGDAGPLWKKTAGQSLESDGEAVTVQLLGLEESGAANSGVVAVGAGPGAKSVGIANVHDQGRPCDVHVAVNVPVPVGDRCQNRE